MMGVEYKAPGHWSDAQLIEHLYGVGPEGIHIDHCQDCQKRLLEMQAHRRSVELDSLAEEAVSHDFLMAQRRGIYAKLERPEPWFSGSAMKRWASTAIALFVLSGGVLLYEQKHRELITADHVSDVQLARDVSQMAQDPEAEPTAPLQALFN
ncbi:MAG TPA: hypothetical protein VGG97_11770 [Bryobacteraceae bacterium]|jgi:hypothetical protein